MHIAFISSENPFSMNNGGIGAYCKYMIEMMAYGGNDVSFITVNGDEEKEISLKSVNNSGELRIYLLRYKLSQSTFPMDMMELFYEKVKQIHKRYPIDVIECQDWLGIGCLIAENMDIPFVTRLHSPLFLIEKIAEGQRIYRFSEDIKKHEMCQIQKSTALSSPSADLANIIYHESGLKANVIPNPISLADFDHDTEYVRPELVKDRKYILYLGRLEYRKGVLILAEALCEFLKNHPEYQVVICGKDTIYKKKSVRNLMKEKCAGFENALYFLDNVFGDQKMAYIKHAHFIIQPSLWENFSYVTLECMACGKTLVCTQSGGFIEMIEDGKSGFLAEPYSADSLVSKMELALESNLDQIEEQAKRKVSEYDISVLRESFQQFYATVIQ